MNTGIWMVEYRSLLSDDRRWVRATELGQHSTKRRAEKAAKDGLSAAYEHVRVVNIKESPNASGKPTQPHD